MDLISAILSAFGHPIVSGPVGLLSVLLLYILQRNNAQGWRGQLLSNVLQTATAMLKTRPEMTKGQLVSFALSYGDLTATAARRQLTSIDEHAIASAVGLLYDNVIAAKPRQELTP